MANYSKGLATKERILSISRKLFYEKGFIATSFNEIYRSAQVNPGSISYHFKSKKAIAESIYNDMMAYEGNTIKELFPDEDELTILILGVCVHQKLLFIDEAYRRFSVEINIECFRDIIQDKYEHFVPAAYSYITNKVPPEKVDFFLVAVAGADSRIESYIDQNIERIDYETTVRNTCEIYLYLLDGRELTDRVDKAIKMADKLEITNEGFDISIRFKED